LPDAVDPDDSNTTPDMPEDDTFAETKRSTPDPLLTLLPDDTITLPPAPLPCADPPFTNKTPPAASADRVSPLAIERMPPSPLEPLPTTTLTNPPRPPVDTPLRIVTPPLFPDMETPDSKVMVPLTPVELTTPLPIVTAPEPEDKLLPELTSTRPPTPVQDEPALRLTAPPAPAPAVD
jgi:hypothetical protein